MKAILGLGNPGLRFRFSRHNLGTLVVQRLARAKKIKIKQRANNCILGKGRIGEQEILLVKPLAFMNLSGEVVAPLVRRKKIKATDLLIVLDDVNLPLGKIRIRARGSDGGHKGLRSIIEALGTEAFARLRIGVNSPKENAKKGRLTEYVLGRFTKEESKIVNAALREAVSCCHVWARDGIQAAMSRFN